MSENEQKVSDEELVMALGKMAVTLSKMSQTSDDTKEKNNYKILIQKINSFKTRIQNEQSEQTCEIETGAFPDKAPKPSFFRVSSP